MDDPAAYYNLDPELEWNRLFSTPYRRLEWEVMLYFLNRYLPPQGRVLDLGGGPGRYTLELARRGYQVTLVDRAERNIAWARVKIQAAGLSGRMEACRVGDARNLEGYPEAVFDAVLCMGPLYHLPKRADRVRCLRECARVMKHEAPLFATWLPRTVYLRDALRGSNNTLPRPGDWRAMIEILERGTSPLARIPSMYYCTVEEIQSGLEETGFDMLNRVSAHGAAAFLDEAVNQAARDAETWRNLVQVVLETCGDPHALSAAEHLIVIGRKKSRQEKSDDYPS
ncbi:MAG: class I SAM-dependent methyltransferase [bacterium]